MSATEPIEVYHYPKCSTCRKALKWLDAHDIAYTKIDIVEQPPSKAKLGRALTLADVELRKLFNSSGQSYRQGDWKTKLPTITKPAALAALAADGKLIKRPLLLSTELALIGFNEADWAAKLS